MNDLLNRYFMGELTEQEINDFLLEIDKDYILKEEFIEIQNLMGFSKLLFRANDHELAQLNFNEFIKYIKNR